MDIPFQSVNLSTYHYHHSYLKLKVFNDETGSKVNYGIYAGKAIRR